MRTGAALCGLLAFVALAPSAGHALPEESFVLIQGASVDDVSLPPLFVTDQGVFATHDALAPLQSLPHASTDLLLYEAGATFARVLDTQPPSPTLGSGFYFDPAAGATLRVLAAIVADPFSESRLSLADGREESVANLLSPSGSALFFMPEPGMLAPLVLGALQLGWLRRRRAPRPSPPRTRPLPRSSGAATPWGRRGRGAPRGRTV